MLCNGMFGLDEPHWISELVEQLDIWGTGAMLKEKKRIETKIPTMVKGIPPISPNFGPLIR